MWYGDKYLVLLSGKHDKEITQTAAISPTGVCCHSEIICGELV